MAADSQKFIARNRAPRVQIEYDVELYGTQKTVQLPFVMGVMSDLSGKSQVAQPDVEERRFLEIDAETFDDRLRGIAPRVAFAVPNTLTGEGNLEVDLTFEKMADFSPAAIAARVAPLRPLLEARTQLKTLMAYMDGKAGAEALIEKILADPSLLSAISAATGPAPEPDPEAALDALHAAMPVAEAAPDPTAEVLAGLAAAAPTDVPPGDDTAETLSALAASAPEDTPEEDETARALDLLSDVPTETPAPDRTEDTLAGLAASAPVEMPEEDATARALETLSDVNTDALEADRTGENLTALAASAPVDTPEEDRTAEVLGTLDEVSPDPSEPDTADETLAALATSVPEKAPEEDSSADVLSGLAETAPPDAPPDTTDATLAGLASAEPADTPPDETEARALEALSNAEPAEPEPDRSADALANLAAAASEDVPEETDAAVLDGIARIEPPEPEPDDTDETLAGVASPDLPDAEPDSSFLLPEISRGELAEGQEGQRPSRPDSIDDETLSDLAASAPEDANEEYPLADILGDLASSENLSPEGDTEAQKPSFDLDDLDAILAEPVTGAPEDAPSEDGDEPMADTAPPEGDPQDAEMEASDPLEDLDFDFDPDTLDALLNEPMPDVPEDEPADDPLDDLFAEAEEAAEPAATTGDPLDDLLGDVLTEDAEEDIVEAATDQMTAPPSDAAAPPAETPHELSENPDFAFGTLSGDRPGAAKLERKRFRIAILGDFSGRAARGLLDTGEALAAREPILLDPDTVDDVIAGFATTLVLPIGRDGGGVEVRLKDLDSLHPDELYENVALFGELAGLRSQLSSGATAANAEARLRGWAEAHGVEAAAPRRVSSGSSVPANLRLSEFQRLIGDTGGALHQPSPVEELMARVVGPHIRKTPDAKAEAMREAVDASISSAMRMILHHPEFQSVEAQWRSIDLIARSVEVDNTLEVMLYDISAEEIAADLVTAPDLAQSGLARLLTEGPMDPETGLGGYSALLGLYTFEETPPHADLLGRIARVAAHVDAPFFAAMAPGFLDTAKKDRHPLTAEAWDALAQMPEARHLGLVTPRFLLRRPYGAKSEPIYEFDFEEFTMAEGLRGMLWANPVVLVAILLARSFRKNGKAMNLGSVMSLGDMPYHVMTDRHGDQVQLPCTERNLTESKVQAVLDRGFMPVVSMRGRDEVRLALFHSVGGGKILGPWSGERPPPSPRPDPTPPADQGELDALLAGFDDTTPDAEPTDMDAELAALLDDL